jgi:hypothetical protein
VTGRPPRLAGGGAVGEREPALGRAFARDAIEALLEALDRRELVLFTGAGFSAGACDREGLELPTSEHLVEDLWAICFGPEPYDGESSLQDLYDVAATRHSEALARYLRTRLCVGGDRVGRHHAAFFTAPWRRVYTINVDDVELAVAEHFQLTRPLRLVTPEHSHDWTRAPELEPFDPDVLEVVHLNGRVSDDPRSVTFSTLQYAARLTGAEPLYAGVARELLRYPFVFCGTRLEEVILWQHLHATLESENTHPRARPRSFLVSRHVSRARALLLEDFNVTWLPMSVEDLAEELLGSGLAEVRRR